MVTRLHPYWKEEHDPTRSKVVRQVEDMVKPWIGKAEAVVRERPGLVIGAAVAFGVLLGCLVKRR